MVGEARQSGSERAKKKEKKKEPKKKGRENVREQTNKRTSRGPNVREEGGALKREKTSDSLLRLDRVGS